MSFRIGQSAVCINSSGWEYIVPRAHTTGWWIFKKTTYQKDVTGPAKGGVVKIIGFSPFGDGHLKLAGYPQGHYTPTAFRPIDPLHEALDRIEENHDVEVEPVEEPQLA